MIHYDCVQHTQHFGSDYTFDDHIHEYHKVTTKRFEIMQGKETYMIYSPTWEDALTYLNIKGKYKIKQKKVNVHDYPEFSTSDLLDGMA